MKADVGMLVRVIKATMMGWGARPQRKGNQGKP